MVLVDVDRGGIATAAKQPSDDGLEAATLTANVGDPASVERCRDEVDRQAGEIDIHVNNAAVFATVPMSRSGYQDLSVEEWDFMTGVNLRGAWPHGPRIRAPMQQRGYGKVINISLGTAPQRVGRPDYCGDDLAGMVHDSAGYRSHAQA